jgi:tripartite-type tricarboxylate transporter receptor subunit TctC
VGLTSGTPAQAADDGYFKGKTFTVMVATRAGGGTDTTGRLVARFWGDHIPGKPKILVRNKPLQVIGANDLQNKVRPDGLTVGVFAGGGTLGPVMRGSSSVRFNLLDWGYVGSIERGASVQIVRKAALKRMRDPKAKPIAMGSVSTDRTQDATAVFGAEYLGWNLKFVLGYPNSNAIYLAYGRGEIDMFGSGTVTILNRFIKDEGAMALVTEQARPDFPKVPVFTELLRKKNLSAGAWAAFRQWTGPGAVDKYFAAPPKTPKARLDVLQASFMATTSDARFKKQANNIFGGGYAILTGKQTRDAIAGAITPDPKGLAEIKRLRAKYGLPKVSREGKPLVAVTFDKVQRGGRVLLFSYKGKKMKLRVSGSRSEITVAGKIQPRSALKPGMTCMMNWAKRGDRVEARKVQCLAKVTFDKVQRGGRVLLFSHDGKKMKLRVSGSRSEITVGGEIKARSALKAGMTCSLNWAKRGDRVEARKVICP